jgi:hypothetical protein
MPVNILLDDNNQSDYLIPEKNFAAKYSLQKMHYQKVLTVLVWKVINGIKFVKVASFSLSFTKLFCYSLKFKSTL